MDKQELVDALQALDISDKAWKAVVRRSNVSKRRRLSSATVDSPNARLVLDYARRLGIRVTVGGRDQFVARMGAAGVPEWYAKKQWTHALAATKPTLPTEIVIRDPSLLSGDDVFAVTLCHEIGHWVGVKTESRHEMPVVEEIIADVFAAALAKQLGVTGDAMVDPFYYAAVEAGKIGFNMQLFKLLLAGFVCNEVNKRLAWLDKQTTEEVAA